MRHFSSREAKRLMDRMGLNSKDMPEVKEVIFRTSNKELVVNNPTVTALEIQGQKIYQVVGEGIKEQPLSGATLAAAEPKLVIPEEDVQLVAEQSGAGYEAAKVALEETKGDLAQAILILASRKKK